MSLPWIPLAVDFPTSRKAIALAVALGEPLAWAYVVRLWTWAARHAADGRIEGPDATAVVEQGAAWQGRPGAFVEALALPHVRLLDLTPQGFLVHDWDEHCGAHVAKRQRDRDRMRELRSRTVREPFANSRRTFADSPGEREREKESDR